MKFEGSVAECLMQYAELLPKKGSRGRSKFYTPLVDFVSLLEGTIVRWLHEKNPQVPIGLPMLRAAFFFELFGGEVTELVELRRNSLISYRLAELIAFGVVTVEEVAELLEYKNNSTNEVVGLICRNRRTSRPRETLLQELIADSAVEIQSRRQAAIQKLQGQLSELFGENFFANNVAAPPEVTTSLAPVLQVASKVPNESVAPADAPIAEPVSDEVPDEVASAEVPKEPVNNDQLVSALGHFIFGLELLMKEMVDRGTPEDRQRLRKITTKGGEMPGETMFRVSNLFDALCGEKARARVLDQPASPSQSPSSRKGQEG